MPITAVTSRSNATSNVGLLQVLQHLLDLGVFGDLPVGHLVAVGQRPPGRRDQVAQVAWMSAPRWDSEGVFSSLIGYRGAYAVTSTGRFVTGRPTRQQTRS